ncbi:MAG: L,D-transpeptidase [Clostridiaceae bacterium]|jgi:hypothetical protein|nr:L,D-transpeptidase [Clostridiaceae bacterium]
MKKNIVRTFIITIIILFMPCFINNTYSNEDNIQSDSNLVNNNVNKSNTNIDNTEKADDQNEITTFVSNTCFKKTYYISGDIVNMYSDNSGADKVIFTLHKDDIVVAYKEINGYIYCEEGNSGKKGWVRKNTDNLKGELSKNTQYEIDVNLTKQSMVVKKDDMEIKSIKCSTGTIGNSDTETPLGQFFIQSKGEYFFSKKYDEGARYYIKFFANYLIHSIPIDEKGNIIEEERNKLGFPASHGCIRVSMEDAKWIYDKVPKGSAILIHY